MRRFVDVIFVDPKIKRYVVLHQGKFWQLPRMNLSVNAWSLKQPFTGELTDIFVAKEQGVACAELAQTLKTYELPPQLHGLDAIGFLGWWSTNDYKWLSTQDVLVLGNDEVKDGTKEAAKTLDKPTSEPAFDISKTNKPAPTTSATVSAVPPVASVSVSTPEVPVSQTASADLLGNFNNLNNNANNTNDLDDDWASELADISAIATPAPAPVTPTPSSSSKAEPAQAPIAQTLAPKPTPKPEPKSADEAGFDVFDSLLNELTEEILHPH